MEGYAHSPITEPRRIRIFTMASASSEDEDIRGSLIEISLDAEPIEKYWALSYTWDGQRADQEILCEGSKLLVTKNCFAALKGMRSSDAEVRVWIDNMCINQNDLAERSHQVALMGDIYKEAAQVMVWLGEWSPAIREAMQIMSYVAGPNIEDPVSILRYSYVALLDESEKKGTESEDEPRAGTASSFQPRQLGTSSSTLCSTDSVRTTPESIRAGLRVRAEEVYNSKFTVFYYCHIERQKADSTAKNPRVLDPFLKVPWFTRVWTVQEVVLSTPANVLFFSSKGERITWAQVIAALDTLYKVHAGSAWQDYSGYIVHDTLTKLIGNHRKTVERFPSHDPTTTSLNIFSHY